MNHNQEPHPHNTDTKVHVPEHKREEVPLPDWLNDPDAVARSGIEYELALAEDKILQEEREEELERQKLAAEYPLPAWLVSDDNPWQTEEDLENVYKELGLDGKVDERPQSNLPLQPLPPKSNTYNAAKETINAVEVTAYDRFVATKALEGHDDHWGNGQYEKLVKLHEKYPTINMATESWLAKLMGENIGLPFGKGFSEVLVNEKEPVSITERAAKLAYCTTELYADLKLRGEDQRNAALNALDGGKKDLEVKGYDRMFGMRIAGEDADFMHVPKASNYIVVTTADRVVVNPQGKKIKVPGNMYEMQVLDGGKPIEPERLKANFDALLEYDKEVNQKKSESQWLTGTSYAPLTFMDRRELNEVTSEMSKNVLFHNMTAKLNGALFTISLDEESDPQNETQVAQLTQFGAVIESGDVKTKNLNTINGAGITFTLFKNGAAGAKAEHLLVDGNEHGSAMNYITTKANGLKLSTEKEAAYQEGTQNFALMRWNIPQRYIDRAEAYHDQEVSKRNLAVDTIEGVSSKDFGKWTDPVLQIALNLAYADIKGEVLKKQQKLVDPPHQQTNFSFVEPVHNRGTLDGRVLNPQLNGEPLSKYMQEAIIDPNSEKLPELLREALLDVRGRVRAAKSNGDAYLTQLMMFTTAEKFDPTKPFNNLPEAARYMRELEVKFNKLTPTKAMQRLTQAEAMGSNFGKADKNTGVSYALTVDSLLGNGITSAIIEGTENSPTRIGVRATGDYAPYTKHYIDAVQKRALDILAQFKKIDPSTLETPKIEPLLPPLRRGYSLGRRGQYTPDYT
jgi:hypothetical protein